MCLVFLYPKQAQTYSTTCNGALQTQTALDYYPYGKELRAYNSAAEKYKSTHNERDLETGYENMGARLYDSDVSRFLSLDALAMQYPSVSSYVYVAGNPILFTDPTGKEIRVFYGNEDSDYVIYKNGAYNNADGSVYTGNNEFLKNAMKSFQFLENSNTAKDIVNNLANADASEFILNVKGIDESAGTFTFGINDQDNEGTVFYNPESVTVDALNGKAQLPAISFLHELDHGNRALELYRSEKSKGSINSPKQVWSDNPDTKRESYSVYDTKEEERVVKGNETKVILELKKQFPKMQGLNTRESHWGSSYPSIGPLSIVKKPTSTSPKPIKK